VLPRNYDELAEHYGQFIGSVVRRLNKVSRSHEDLQSHIWVKLIEAKFLDRFEDFRCRKRPTDESRALQNYLRVAIRNHFANYCRTAARSDDAELVFGDDALASGENRQAGRSSNHATKLDPEQFLRDVLQSRIDLGQLRAILAHIQDVGGTLQEAIIEVTGSFEHAEYARGAIADAMRTGLVPFLGKKLEDTGVTEASHSDTPRRNVRKTPEHHVTVFVDGIPYEELTERERYAFSIQVQLTIVTNWLVSQDRERRELAERSVPALKLELQRVKLEKRVETFPVVVDESPDEPGEWVAETTVFGGRGFGATPEEAIQAARDRTVDTLLHNPAAETEDPYGECFDRVGTRITSWRRMALFTDNSYSVLGLTDPSEGMRIVTRWNGDSHTPGGKDIFSSFVSRRVGDSREELDHITYDSEAEALRGHVTMVSKWSNRKSG